MMKVEKGRGNPLIPLPSLLRWYLEVARDIGNSSFPRATPGKGRRANFNTGGLNVVSIFGGRLFGSPSRLLQGM